MRPRRTDGFTLIEMLTVIVIIGIMLAATLPAVNNLMKSSGLSVATRQVANTLGLARQLAITQRVYARVVFPYDTTGGHPDMRYCTYAVMTNGDNTVTLGWVYVSKWEYLPVGVVFLRNFTGLGALNDPASLNHQSNLPFPDSNPLIVGELVYIEFNPSGVATPLTTGPLAPSVLAITEGFMSGGLPTPTSKNGATALANVTTITVDPLVGRIQVARP